jgi:hypothetical protein
MQTGPQRNGPTPRRPVANQILSPDSLSSRGKELSHGTLASALRRRGGLCPSWPQAPPGRNVARKSSWLGVAKPDFRALALLGER